jgi:prevent-host-death family protein
VFIRVHPWLKNREIQPRMNTDEHRWTRMKDRSCANAKSVYFSRMKATLTELRRNTSRVVRAADNGQEVILTEHGQPRYRLEPIKPIDRKAAAAALRAIGPVDFLPRK